jgi:GT2 family glycosyltransferase
MSTCKEKPLVSVIIPVHNGGKELEKCLNGLKLSSYEPYEVVVVDDASTDRSGEIAEERGATVFRLPTKSGPAAARNYGARRARGEILVFIDSDVVVKSDTLERLASALKENPDIAAVFGSYDDSPESPDFLSQFRNLFHHFIHQTSSKEAQTFWAGCGAIRRDVFLKLGGFDETRYTKASIEDIELGLRLRRDGYRILLDKNTQVKHLKQWKWISWLKTDILHRAIPWSRLIIESGSILKDLNLKTSSRISAMLTGAIILVNLLIILGFLKKTEFSLPSLFALLLVLIAAFVILNHRLYIFLLKKRGLFFAIRSIPLHFLYYLYSGISFMVCWILYKAFSHFRMKQTRYKIW